MCPIVNISCISVSSLLWTATSLYLFAFIYVLSPILRNRTYYRSIFYTLLVGGFLFQTMGLYMRGVQTGALPLNSHLETIQATSWIAIFLIILIQTIFSLRLLGFFGCGLVCILNVFSLVTYKLPERAQHLLSFKDNPWIEFHIILAIVGYSALGLSAIISTMYLLQDYGLHKKLGGGIYSRLPSLSKLTNMAARLFLIGAIFYGLAVVIGTLIWLTDSGNAAISKMYIKWISILSLFALYYFGIHIKKISFKKFSWFNITLFGLLLADFLL